MGKHWVRQHRDDLQRALDQVRGHLDDLTVTANVVGAELTINDTSMGRLPRAALTCGAGPGTVGVACGGRF